MKKPLTPTHLTLLSLTLLLLPLYSSAFFHFLPPNSAILSKSRAANLIRSLNLFPRDAEPVRDGEDPAILKNGQKIVERRFRFSNLVDNRSTESVEELGHHAGYYKIEHSHAAKLFYLFFESRGSKDDPLVIWLTGGPGCSSELAVFYENGPFKIADDLSLVWNDYGWDKASNLLFVDQPTGTGFSYSSDIRDLRHDEGGVSNDLYDFLQAFFAKHPEYTKNEFYITGESYAGHYIPAFAARVHQGNKAKEGVHVNLKGFAIGNGLTDPAIQYKAYTDYALDMGLIKQSQYTVINKLLPTCELALKLCGTDGKLTCLASLVLCQSIFQGILTVAGNINYYDIRKECVGSLCYDFSNLEKFLNQKSVRSALGVGNIDFVSCSPTVHLAMLMDTMRNLEVGIPALLEDGIKMLIYAGEYDLICNWLGNSRWVESVEWSGKKQYLGTPVVPFMVNDTVAGDLKAFGALSFLKVHNSGHMIPMDQPKAALEMLKRWIAGDLAEGAEANIYLKSDAAMAVGSKTDATM